MQGVCLGGGGGGECLATAAPALKCCASPEKVAEQGGRGVTPTHRMRTKRTEEE